MSASHTRALNRALDALKPPDSQYLKAKKHVYWLLGVAENLYREGLQAPERVAGHGLTHLSEQREKLMALLDRARRETRMDEKYREILARTDIQYADYIALLKQAEEFVMKADASLRKVKDRARNPDKHLTYLSYAVFVRVRGQAAKQDSKRFAQFVNSIVHAYAKAPHRNRQRNSKIQQSRSSDTAGALCQRCVSLADECRRYFNRYERLDQRLARIKETLDAQKSELERRVELEGRDDDPLSIAGLVVTLAAIDVVFEISRERALTKPKQSHKPSFR